MPFPDSIAFKNVMSSFAFIQKDEKLKDEIRAMVSELEMLIYEIMKVIHLFDKYILQEEVHLICAYAKEMFIHVRKCYSEIQAKVPFGTYYKYHEIWRFPTQQILYTVAFITYFDSGKLLDIECAASYLGVHAHQLQGFHIDLTDFCLAILRFCDKLARLCTKYVNYGSYTHAKSISAFLTNVSAGFSELNFKNDALRRKYDGLKYHVRRVEEINLDITMYHSS